MHITVEDKVFQASSPIRHATETVKIIREVNSDDGVNCAKPILIRYTDGGPDHRTTYKYVHFFSVLEFVDLDLFVACRTAPNQSYKQSSKKNYVFVKPWLTERFTR